LNTVGVVGLGYVGLTLAVTLARKGFTVHGMDSSRRVLASLAAKRPHLFEPGVEEGLRAFLGERLHVGLALPERGVEAAVLCVSTPVNPDTHAPELEKKYVAEGKLLNRRLVMYNDFVIVGPSNDPAKASSTRSAAEACCTRSRVPWRW